MATGVNGKLGHDVVLRLKELNIDVVAPGKDEFDLTNRYQIQKYISKEKSDVIIHCAEYTAVDKAENQKDICYLINLEGTRFIVEIAKQVNAKLVYVSIDHVFDGLGDEPIQKIRKLDLLITMVTQKNKVRRL